MSRDYVPIDNSAKKARPMRTILIAAIIAFLAGSIAMGWILKSWEGGMNFLRPASSTEVTQPNAIAVLDGKIGANGTVGTVTPVVVTPLDSGTADQLAARVRDLEQKLETISVSAQAASGNAARAEGLLVAFAARRALDRGVALGYIEGQLRTRFGDAQPRAVATVIAAARQPITLEELQINLNELGPELTGGGSNEGWWDGFKREMSEIIVIRKAGTPSPLPVERLSRAKRRLEGGQVDAALAEVARMPGRAKAENWMAAARRYIEARRALDIIETAAILEPKTETPVPDVAPIATPQTIAEPTANAPAT